MGAGEERLGAIAPMLAAVAPLNPEKEEHWSRFDDSVNAVSFGFVATAILISMFLVMATFERFLRPRSPPSLHRPDSDLEAHMLKPPYASPKMRVYSSDVSVLMPGDEIPTYIGRPALVPCPPNCKLKSLHWHSLGLSSSSSSSRPNGPEEFILTLHKLGGCCYREKNRLRRKTAQQFGITTESHAAGARSRSPACLRKNAYEE